MITFLLPIDIGRWIEYRGNPGKQERGKIKSFNNDTGTAYVVYKADNNWDGDRWKDYTAQGTKYADLYWPGGKK